MASNSLGACRETSLMTLLDDFKLFPGLSVHWVMVGPSGRDERTVDGGVLRHYDRCAGQASQGTKIIANTYFLRRTASHPHNLEFRCVSSQAVHTIACPVSHATSEMVLAFFWRSRRPASHPPMPQNRTLGSTHGLPAFETLHANDTSQCAYAQTEGPVRRGQAHPVNEQRYPLSHQYLCSGEPGSSCSVDPGWRFPTEQSSVERLGLYHFVTRSRADFATKIARGPGDSPTPKAWSFFEDAASYAQAALHPLERVMVPTAPVLKCGLHYRGQCAPGPDGTAG